MAENGRSRGPSGPKGTPNQIQKHRTKIQDEEDRFEKMWEELDNSDEDGADIDPDKFLREMDILDRLNPVPDFDLKPWEDVWKEASPLLDDPDSADQQSSASAFEKRPKRRRPTESNFRRFIALMVIVGILLVATSCGALARFLQAIGVDTENTFFFEMLQVLRVDNPKPERTNIDQYTSLEDALDAYGVTSPSAEMEFPVGYSFTKVIVQEYSDEVKFLALYSNGIEEIAFTIWHYHDSTSLELQAAEKLPQDAEKYVANGVDHYILENTTSTSIAWISGTEAYYLLGDYSAHQAKQMINSIYEGNQ